MKYDYWKMRGWTVVHTQPPQQQDDDDDDNFTNVDEVVKSLDDLFDIIKDSLGEDADVFIEEITATDVEETAEDAYDRAMKGV